jgi:Cu+-exporting ATPase
MAVETLSMAIRGMTCANCARGVERTFLATPGVTKATVDLRGASATVRYDAGKVTPQALAAAVRKLGYEVAA